jgi:threonine dehydratase
MTRPTIEALRAAAARIAPLVHRTPVLRCRSLDRELGAEVFAKCENFQRVGAFKARGAVNAVAMLSGEEARRGVITHSSGNHGAALAYAASARGMQCTVVTPETAPQVKLQAIRAYGADVVTCPQPMRQQVTDGLMAETGATFIHPFENPHVIAGAGTAALELMEEHPDLEFVVVPVGGGGLVAGTTIAVAAMAPRCKVIGAEPAAVDDAFRSLATGIRQPAVVPARSVADGLLTGLGQLNFDILVDHQIEIVTMAEEEIVDATLFVMQRLKIVIEPSSGTVIAALRRMGDRIAGRKVGVIFSGGNTDFSFVSRESEPLGR